MTPVRMDLVPCRRASSKTISSSAISIGALSTSAPAKRSRLRAWCRFELTPSWSRGTRSMSILIGRDHPEPSRVVSSVTRSYASLGGARWGGDEGGVCRRSCHFIGARIVRDGIASPALAAANGQVDGATRTWKRRGRDRATAGRLFVQALGPARDRGESSRRRWYHWDHRVPHRH